MLSRFYMLVLVVLAAAVLPACNVGPERSVTGDRYTDTDSPMNVVRWSADDDLVISGQGDPSALNVSDDGIALATEGIGTALGITPDGSIFAWSPKDVEIESLSFTVTGDGRVMPTEIHGLKSNASDVRRSRAELAAIVASQITDLADDERDATLEALRVLESAGIPFAIEVLRAIAAGGL